ncbi:MAG: RsiV family protein [Prevotella sp.]|uniref:RsiV family protein n=1 Tax=Prevotella sp. TaxID=59823 RepID=UPI002A2C5465|nr:RsiV family protein [Prevotella sp.]MDD7318222.1 RsiV family protein [Prevotellaceae bacterium]MDY4020889.1 RsiV family protein [Prevotella sp.]
MAKNKTTCLLVTLITSAALFFLSSCDSRSGADGGDLLSFHAYSIRKDTTVSLTRDSLSPACKLHLDIIFSQSDSLKDINFELLTSGILTPDYFSIGGRMTSMEEALDSFVCRYTEEYKRDYASLYSVDKENPKSYDVNYSVKTSVKQGRKGIVVYVAEACYGAGAVHDTNTMIAKNIDVDNKKVLGLEDVIVEGSAQFISELIIKELCDEKGVDNLEQLQAQSIFKGITPYPSSNFMLAEDGVVFIYNADEIATHDVGRILVKIDYSDINKYLKIKG